MLNYNAIQKEMLERFINAKLSEERLKEIRKESELLCDSIESGLFAIGDMMEKLGCFADDGKQGFSDTALDNEIVSHLGAFIKANAYLLSTLRDTASNADFQINGGTKGAK
ncbi:hypothetical protein [Aggregatibacter actinomycetemcomitans]|uniref:hypothetical protein n=1 Tax=Aggregatibacter actinomycetemcomitans TaxID=714 RepID=UPI00022ABB75|nr:hypothetical protein [Aggregatibacter actinomycetemcomitans]KOE65876.1 hypothetical protein A160_0204355 [Aggregatibacter actinomycetemcomitans serotype e str. A160]KOE66623.1 hypothetical protein SCC393_0304715 [Aggregatibacter actinomycetemcomitans serotype e str. SCC393]KYK76584.1 hypothetical protein SA2876_06765 [Aggregatibacter actinomycetemcomitans serotype e str. SA2876]TYA48640.1 hypothetical protein FXB74_08725 [Aggregatibacter actinomycetemcomitans]